MIEHDEATETETKQRGSGSALNCLVICRLLLDGYSKWKVVDEGSFLEKMVHKDGYWYYTGCGGIIAMSKGNIIDIGTEKFCRKQLNLFSWVLIGPLGFINTLMVKGR